MRENETFEQERHIDDPQPVKCISDYTGNYNSNRVLSAGASKQDSMDGWVGNRIWCDRLPGWENCKKI